MMRGDGSASKLRACDDINGFQVMCVRVDGTVFVCVRTKNYLHKPCTYHQSTLGLVLVLSKSCHCTRWHPPTLSSTRAQLLFFVLRKETTKAPVTASSSSRSRAIRALVILNKPQQLRWTSYTPTTRARQLTKKSVGERGGSERSSTSKAFIAHTYRWNSAWKCRNEII